MGYQCHICGFVSSIWPFDLARSRQACGHLTRYFRAVAERPCSRCSWLCWPSADGKGACRSCTQRADLPPRPLSPAAQAEVERCPSCYLTLQQERQSQERSAGWRQQGEIGGWFCLLLLVCWVASISSSPTLAAPPWTSASLLAPTPTSGQSRTPVCPTLRTAPTFGVSLIEVQTGQPLCERNANGIAQPASTTKVMAALLVGVYLQVHRLGLGMQVTVQPADLQVEPDAAVAGLHVGRAYSVRLLLAMTSILSAADAVTALARFVAGSRSAFLLLMNQQAKALGMTRTHFSSPYGYARTPAGGWQQGETSAVGNYASAHDLALLMVAFARFPDLVHLFGLAHYEEAGRVLDRRAGVVLPDLWGALNLPFQVLAVKKGCMWCEESLHKLSYIMLVRYQQQVVAASFLYATQNYGNPRVGDILTTLLWAFHLCDQHAYASYCQ